PPTDRSMSWRPLSLTPIVLALLAWGAGPMLAQSPPPAQNPAFEAPAAPVPSKPATDRNGRRLFQRFIEDAAVIPGGWVEGQYRYEKSSDGSSHFAGPLIAFKVARDVEAGLRFGFLDVRPDRGPSNSGTSDIDLYAKYRLPGGPGRFALGVLAKAATADETKGLGTGKPDYEIFGAYRVDLEAVSLVANTGVRFNGQPDPPSQSSTDSYLVGGAILLPTSQRPTFVIEGSYETERLHGGKDDGRLTLGFQSYGEGRRGGFRGAVGFPMTNGAPDLELLFGAFLTY